MHFITHNHTVPHVTQPSELILVPVAMDKTQDFKMLASTVSALLEQLSMRFGSSFDRALLMQETWASGSMYHPC